MTTEPTNPPADQTRTAPTTTLCAADTTPACYTTIACTADGAADNPCVTSTTVPTPAIEATTTTITVTPPSPPADQALPATGGSTIILTLAITCIGVGASIRASLNRRNN